MIGHLASWRQMSNDGPITCPRWMHHVVVKLCAQHGAPAALLWAISCAIWPGGRPVLAATIAGPGCYVIIRLSQKIWESRSWHWSHFADIITDGLLATCPVAVAYLAIRNYPVAAGLGAICVTGYMLCHRWASP